MQLYYHCGLCSPESFLTNSVWISVAAAVGAVLIILLVVLICCCVYPKMCKNSGKTQ